MYLPIFMYSVYIYIYIYIYIHTEYVPWASPPAAGPWFLAAGRLADLMAVFIGSMFVLMLWRPFWSHSVPIGCHLGDLGHFLLVLGTLGAGHGIPEGAKWDSDPGGSTVLLESRMPDRRAVGSEIPFKSKVKYFPRAVPTAVRQVTSTWKLVNRYK